ncbi:HAMP domain-containing protein [Geomonas nitrogeniifigens]|uniref:histidine kinase n=1 Tax=Geomonas diazotrophica TaxID=2843197 RepID=A0ABX8JIP4_9BACT|nr:ATP-binding protein [Geomonas nitrogeniifigens]QWV97382.1 HAMP domain-containing protein [Geomonas nitrogeniifigens]QXE86540.1 HAMP domain-containing protein [Geomonas nitrogeniifigens]
MQPRFGIRTKLLLSILAILLISYSTLIYSTMKTMSASLRTEVDRNLDTNLTYARSQYLDRAKVAKYSLLQPATSRLVQERLTAKDRAWLDDRLKVVHQVLPYLDFLLVLDGKKRIVAGADTGSDGEELYIPGVLDQALAGKRVVNSTEILPAAVLCQAGAKRYCEQESNAEALVNTVVVPVLGGDGSILGCFVAGEILNNHATLPSDLQEVSGSDVEVSITQRDLRIASSLPRTLRDTSTLSPRVIDVLERGEVYRGEARIGSRDYETVIDPILNSRGEFVGSISVAVATERFSETKRENLENILASAFIGILCSFGLAFLASRHLTGPLRQLAASARKIEQGDLDQRVEGHQDDEVGVLASSFNKMVQALRERDSIINKKTSDLQELNEQLERMVDDRTSALVMEMGRLEAVLTSLAEAVVVTDLNNRVVLFNPAAQQLFELVPHRVVGQPIEQVCELVGFTPLLERIRELAQPERGGGTKEELTVKGKRLYVYLSSLTDEFGNFAGIVLSIRDVTVEQQVDRMKTEFISTVSHELKTPLTSIKGSLQLLLTRSKWLTDTERQLLTVCFRNTQRLIRLISEILDISGIESGGMVFKFKPVSIGELTVYAVEEIKSYAMGRDITIVNTVGEHLPRVYGDSDRLIQVITNLLSNAVKFSPEGKVVMISAEQEGNYVVVSVADKGRVIQWSDRDKLFKKFQQIECQERGKVGGTGLGLAICKEIVERHHGRIFYTAAQERGNTFSFTVPIIGETDAKGQDSHSR